MIPNKDLCIDSENGKIVLNGDKYDLGTQGEIDTAVKDVYSVMGQMGAKNLLVPEWVETKTIENGVTYTFNADGTIIMNTDASGATANTNCNLRQNTLTTNNVFPAGTYTLTACPAGGSSTTYRTWARAYRPGTNTALTDNLYEEGNGVSFTVSEPFSLGLNVTVMSGYVCNNLTWKPMLRLASDTDNTYEPYAMTNKQLTEKVEELAGSITYTDITVNKNTTGYAAPVESAGGVYYETLATYAALDIPKDKILNIILVDWHDTAKSFNYYLGAASVGVLTDSAVSIYKDTAAADLTLRIVYKN